MQSIIKTGNAFSKNSYLLSRISSTMFHSKNMDNYQKKPNIAIIGGGLSGMASAEQLINCRPCSITILEATSRPGGRLATGVSPQHKIPYDKGALLFTNADKQMIDLAQRLDVPLIQREDMKHQRYSIGGQWQDIGNLHGLFGQYIVGPLLELGIQDEKDWLKQPQLSKMSLIEFLEKSTEPAERDEVIDAILSTMIGLFSDDPNDFSVIDAFRFFSQYLPAEQFFSAQGGNQQITDRYASYLQQRDVKIMTDHPVTHVAQEDDNVIVTFNSPTGYQQKVFDGVVVAVPMTMLQNRTSHAIEFEPPLPPNQQQAINQMKNNQSVMRVFAETDAIQPLPWTEQGCPTAATIIGKAEQQGAIWIEDHSSHLDKPGAVIELHASGPIATTIQQSANPTQTAMDYILQVYPSLKDKITIFDIVLWKDQPYQLGAYPYNPCDNIEHIEQLSQPYGLITFAGDYISISHPSSAQGAVTTGIKAGSDMSDILDKRFPLEPEHYADESEVLTPG